MTSVMTLCAIVGPPMANGLFALFIGAQSPMLLPGAPFFACALLCLISVAMALRMSSATASEVGPPLQLNYSVPPK